MRGIGTLAGENIFPNKVYLKYSSRIEDSHKGKKKNLRPESSPIVQLMAFPCLLYTVLKEILMYNSN